MKKLLFALTLLVSPAYADYQIYTHGGAGGATGQWNINIAKLLSTVTTKPVDVLHVKGSGGRKAVDEYLQNVNAPTILSTSSEYATEYMVNPKWAKHDFLNYCPLLINNHSSVVYTHNDVDPMTFTTGSIAIHGKATPDVMGLVMLALGPGKTTQEYLDYIGPDGINAISGMKGPDRRLGILNGELDFSRAPGSRVLKEDTLMGKIESPRGGFKPLFNWGVQVGSGIVNDPNEVQRGPLFEHLFEDRWGVAPDGNFYKAMRTAANASHLMDALIVLCESPYRSQMLATVALAISDQKNLNTLKAYMGDYEWFTGDLAMAVWNGVNGALTEPATTSIIAKVYKATGQKAKPRN